MVNYNIDLNWKWKKTGNKYLVGAKLSASKRDVIPTNLWTCFTSFPSFCKDFPNFRKVHFLAVWCIQYQVHKYNVYHLFDVLTWKSTEKGRETYRDIQYKSKPKYILWQHRTFHIPLWDQGHTTPEVVNDFFFYFFILFFNIYLFIRCRLTRHCVISKMSSWQLL